MVSTPIGRTPKSTPSFASTIRRPCRQVCANGFGLSWETSFASPSMTNVRNCEIVRSRSNGCAAESETPGSYPKLGERPGHHEVRNDAVSKQRGAAARSNGIGNVRIDTTKWLRRSGSSGLALLVAGSQLISGVLSGTGRSVDGHPSMQSTRECLRTDRPLPA